MQTPIIGPRQFVAAQANQSPTRASDYAEKSYMLSAGLARLNEEIQQMESALAPALKTADCDEISIGESGTKIVTAPLIDTLETYALLANSMASRVSELRSRLCF
jgi:hypothetical protein